MGQSIAALTQPNHTGDNAMQKTAPCTGFMSCTKGFTLIEMMISMAIFAIISTAVYATYNSQQRAYIDQEQIAELQQNARAAIFFMERDFKQIGFDPMGDAQPQKDSRATATLVGIRFAFDTNGDTEVQDDEFLRYALESGKDTNGDGLVDAACGTCSLGRETGFGSSASGLQPVADNIQALEFYYHLDNGTATTEATPSKIQSVDVSLLVRTGKRISNYVDTKRYYPASNPGSDPADKHWGPFNDGFRRKLFIANIKSRNTVWTVAGQ